MLLHGLYIFSIYTLWLYIIKHGYKKIINKWYVAWMLIQLSVLIVLMTHTSDIDSVPKCRNKDFRTQNNIINQ